ncbi:MAG TPA: hypothetical protein VGF94_23660 [Kofleriaceae bacterium]|jgi:hypothetical protein
MRGLSFLALVAGCAGPGALHQATLVGQCAESDAACSKRHPLAPIAIGAHFQPEVSAEIDGTASPSLQLESVDPSVIAVDHGELVAKRAGASEILISTDDGSVVDFELAWAAPVTELTLAHRDGDRVAGTIAMTVGEDVTLVPGLWNGAQRLGGAAEVTWTQSADAPIAVLRDGSLDRRRIRARAAGKSTVTVAFGDASAAIDVEVVP